MTLLYSPNLLSSLFFFAAILTLDGCGTYH